MKRTVCTCRIAISLSKMGDESKNICPTGMSPAYRPVLDGGGTIGKNKHGSYFIALKE